MGNSNVRRTNSLGVSLEIPMNADSAQIASLQERLTSALSNKERGEFVKSVTRFDGEHFRYATPWDSVSSQVQSLR